MIKRSLIFVTVFSFFAVQAAVIDFEEYSKGKNPNTAFDTLVNSGKPTVVDFFFPWCGPCKALAPIFEKVSNDFSGVVNFVKINIEKFESVATRFKIRSGPTVLHFKNGQELKNTRHHGVNNAGELRTLVKNNFGL